jgi:hypothetical protein
MPQQPTKVISGPQMRTNVVETEAIEATETIDLPALAGQIQRTRQEWKSIRANIREMNAALTKHGRARRAGDAALEAATLESDALELAAKKIRRDLLSKEISGLERAVFRARQEEERLGNRSLPISRSPAHLTPALMLLPAQQIRAQHQGQRYQP